jgi:antirestriction protein ArdC
MAKQTADVYQIITDRIVAILEKGTAPWRKPWAGNGSDPTNLVSKRGYSGINYFMLSASEYTSPHWLTYKQAKDLGGHVRKGEKGTPVIFWKLLDREENGEPVEGAKKIPFLRYYTVFNLEQCEGVEIPASLEPKTYAHDPIEAAEAVQLAMPNRPVVNIVQSGRAFYSPSKDSVTVPELSQYAKPEEYYSTLFHELTHSTGHESRLNREGITERHHFGSATYSREELVAEMGAAFLCGHCGIENATLENSAAYLQGWIKALNGDKKLAVVAAAQAQKAANYILNIKHVEDE